MSLAVFLAYFFSSKSTVSEICKELFLIFYSPSSSISCSIMLPSADLMNCFSLKKLLAVRDIFE